MNNEQYIFTIREAYRLGDAFKSKNELFAAEVCYAFAEMKPLPMPIPNDSAVDPNKLSQLIQRRESINYPLPKKCRGKGKGKGKDKDIPQDCLKLIQAFYDPWLQHIKPDMKDRSDEHAQRRMKGVIEVFKAVTNDRLGQLILDDIAKANHNQQIDKIDAWNGPSFVKFQIRDNQKMKNNFSLSRLTVVLDFKNYRKRCRNSQEDWFKLIDGRFFAQCLNKAYKIFVDKFSNERERQYVGIVFIKSMLDKYIQFPSASAKLLVPAGTIFANARSELRETIHRFHPRINPLAIKQQARPRTPVRALHKRLMKDVNTEYDRIYSSMHNPLLSLYTQPPPPPSAPSAPSPEVNTNTNNQQQKPVMMAQESSSFGSEHDDEAETNDDGFLQIINADDVEMHAINPNNQRQECAGNGNESRIDSRPVLERNYSFNGSQSDGSSFVHNGSTSGQSDNENENENEEIPSVWRSSINVPYPVMTTTMVPLPQMSNTRIITNFEQSGTPKITNPFGPSTMEQQQQQQQQQIPYQPQQFQLNEMIQPQPQLPELPDNLNFGFINMHEKNQENQENQENVNVNVNNNGNDESMTQINGTGTGSGSGWDGMTLDGTCVVNVNVNGNPSMIPFINDDNQTSFQPLPQSLTMTMDSPRTELPLQTSCPPQCTCHLNNQHNMQQSLPPVPAPMVSVPTSCPQSQHNYNSTNCDCSFCKGFGSPSTANNPNINNLNMMNSNQSYTPSLHTPSEITQSIVSGDAHSVGSSAVNVAPGFMNGNAPYQSIHIQPPQSQFMPMRQFSSRQSSPASVYGYIQQQRQQAVNISNPFEMNQQQQQCISGSDNLNAFRDDTFEIDNPVTKDVCMGCYESVTQCKCDSIAMNRRYKAQFQNSSTFNTRNNRIHHQNMQSISNFNNNDRKQRRQLYIEQMRGINNNHNYNNYNNNNWNTFMNGRTI